MPRGKKADDFDRVLAEEKGAQVLATSLSGRDTQLLVVNAALPAAIAAFYCAGTYRLQESSIGLGVIAALFIATFLLLRDSLMHNTHLELKTIAAKYRGTSSQPGLEAVWYVTLVQSALFFAGFWTLATYVCPNFEEVIPGLATHRWISAAVACGAPSLLLCAHGRRLI